MRLYIEGCGLSGYFSKLRDSPEDTSSTLNEKLMDTCQRLVIIKKTVSVALMVTFLSKVCEYFGRNCPRLLPRL